MHARVAAFENRDTSRVDELVQLVRDRQSTAGEIPDALGMYMLIDRATGKAAGISIFETEEAIRKAEPAFTRMGDEIPEELRGKRLSVDTYEVAIHEVNAGLYVLPAPLALEILEQATADNDQGEIYLTDVIGGLRLRGKRVAAAKALDPSLVVGVNSQAELVQAEALMAARIRRESQAAVRDR